MNLVSELDLPAFDYSAADFSADRYHQQLAEIRQQGWLAKSPLAYIVLDHEAGERPSSHGGDEPHHVGHRQRLRARFLEAGARALADYELLELVLFRAIPQRDVKPLAKDLIARFGSFGEVISAPKERLRETKGLSDAAVAGIVSRTQAADNDLIFFGADSAKVVNDSIGALRIRVGQDLKMVAAGWRPLWVVDFPMFEWDPEAKRWAAMHHPFTSPKTEDPAVLRADPEQTLAKAYSLKGDAKKSATYVARATLRTAAIQRLIACDVTDRDRLSD